MAVKKVRDEKDPNIAAIGSEEAGKIYGLKVLRRNIEDQPNNFTRFLILARKPATVDLRIPCKTSLIMATSHEEGALLKALSLLHEYKINLTKLESRPRRNRPWHYVFYVDLDGHWQDTALNRALMGLLTRTAFLKLLGSYPAAE